MAQRLGPSLSSVLHPLSLYSSGPRSPERARPVSLLLRHSDLSFSDQVVYLTGHAYERCRFVRCTMVVQGTGNTALVECSFIACAWHLDVILHETGQLEDFEANLLPMIRASVPTLPVNLSPANLSPGNLSPANVSPANVSPGAPSQTTPSPATMPPATEPQSLSDRSPRAAAPQARAGSVPRD